MMKSNQNKEIWSTESSKPWKMKRKRVTKDQRELSCKGILLERRKYKTLKWKNVKNVWKLEFKENGKSKISDKR